MNKSSSSTASTPRDLLTVDLRGMKPTLVACAAERGISVSTLVRELLAQCGAGGQVGGGHAASRKPAWEGDRVRVFLRVSADEAVRLSTGAQAAGLPIGAYVAGLMDLNGSVPAGGDRAAQVAALTRSSAELSTLSRNVGHLAALLRQGAGRAALEYRGMLDALDGEVRAHLALASAVLADPWLQRRRTGSRGAA